MFTDGWQGVRRTYLLLTLLSTLAASLIWGINTLFLLDAGLSNTEAFTANAFFTAGQVLFEVPTGVVADTAGRRVSYLWGAATLLGATLLYLLMWQIEAPLWGWAMASVVIGLGFTFFSGAVEAWLVDALAATGFDGNLEDVFAKGQVVAGVAMLSGSVAGGYLAQLTNLGVPYIVRAALLGLTFLAALVWMRDLGFSPHRGKTAIDEVRTVLRASIDNGLRNPPVRWMMLAAPFTMGAAVYAFYAMQPYLLELFGDPTAFGVAGLAAAIVAGAQIVGGLIVPFVRRAFKRRTTAMLVMLGVNSAVLILMGMTRSFVVALALLVVWGLMFSSYTPIRQAYVNGEVASEQRATVLSFDALMASSGGMVSQPALGRVADVWSYGTSYLVTGAFAAFAVPFAWLARRENAASDLIDHEATAN